MSVASQRELALGIGFHQQSAVQTALGASDIWSLLSTSLNPPFPEHVNEDDAADFGKADEYINNTYASHINAPWEWGCYLSSQNAAQIIAFAFGSATESNPATGAYQYVCVPKNRVTAGPDLPSTTVVGGIRQGTSVEILDMALIGAICDSFEVRLASGTGRSSATISSRWIGCGKYASNSGITVPALTSEAFLRSGGATVITFNGTNYFSGANFVETTIGFANNTPGDAGIYPGSGQQSTAGGNYDIRGRMRMGDRAFTLTHTAEMPENSPELAALLAGTEGTATITVRGALITGATYHQISFVFHRIKYTGLALGESNGFVTVIVTSTVMKHSTNGVCTVTIITNKTGILGAAA